VGTAERVSCPTTNTSAAFAHPTDLVRGSRHKSNKLKSFINPV
jgi:hypothetical protein